MVLIGNVTSLRFYFLKKLQTLCKKIFCTCCRLACLKFSTQNLGCDKNCRRQQAHIFLRQLALLTNVAKQQEFLTNIIYELETNGGKQATLVNGNWLSHIVTGFQELGTSLTMSRQCSSCMQHKLSNLQE